VQRESEEERAKRLERANAEALRAAEQRRIEQEAEARERREQHHKANERLDDALLSELSLLEDQVNLFHGLSEACRKDVATHVESIGQRAQHHQQFIALQLGDRIRRLKASLQAATKAASVAASRVDSPASASRQTADSHLDMDDARRSGGIDAIRDLFLYVLACVAVADKRLVRSEVEVIEKVLIEAGDTREASVVRAEVVETCKYVHKQGRAKACDRMLTKAGVLRSSGEWPAMCSEILDHAKCCLSADGVVSEEEQRAFEYLRERLVVK
jgi:hypothetical protein